MFKAVASPLDWRFHEIGCKKPLRRVNVNRSVLKDLEMKKIALLFFVLVTGSVSVGADDQEIQSLRKQVEELTERVTKLERALASSADKTQTELRVEKQRIKARERMAKDREVYSQIQLREIESLYQVANQKWRSEEGKNSLMDLIKKYDKANRTGCALLYLGQMSDGTEKEEYLNKAIADFSDCWYGDGVQVGAYARLVLAQYCRNSKQPEKAEKLLREVERLFPEAIDHKGQVLTGLTDVQ
jgi:hypothetical protein